MRKAAFVFAWLFLAVCCQGRVIYVDGDASGSNNGSSWANAYNYLQDALADANSRDKVNEIRLVQGIYTADSNDANSIGDVNEIRVARGIYTPDNNTADPNGSGDREATFQLINGVAIKGGYAGIDQPDPNARDIELYETVLSGDLNGDDGPDFTNNSENSYHVVKGSGTDANAVLDGFTVNGGNANGSSSDGYGAGMFNSSGSPTVTNCTFSSNSATYGGGMYNSSNSPNVTNCTFSVNSAVNVGGGMFNAGYGSPTITNCIFSGNSSYDDGGGMANGLSSPTITNCIFINNSAQAGGGMHIWNSSPTVTNCTFSGNSAISGGGGMCNAGHSPTLANCILWGNTASWGLQIYNATSTATVTFSDVQGGYSGAGNINGDPCFVTGPEGDYYLSQTAARQWADSPCVDAGSDTAANLGMDESITRTDGGRDQGVVDMGYHYPLWLGSADMDGNWYVDLFDFDILGGQWMGAPDVPSADIAPAGLDGLVDGLDLWWLSECWLDCYVAAASVPTPANGQTSVERNGVLSWSVGDGAAYHDVYLGTNESSVASAGLLSGEFMGTVADANFDPCTLDFNTTYYWRVDEVGPRCTQTGNVWRFTTFSIGPIGCWEFDEGTGTTAYDSVGGSDGTIYGATWTSGQTGAALELDGVDDYIDVGNDSSLKPPLPVTIAAWVKLSDSGKIQRIVSIDEQSPTYYGIWLEVQATDTLVVGFGDGQGGASQTYRRSKVGTTVIGKEVWYNVAGVIRGGTDMQVYVNGVDDGGSYSGGGGSLAYSSGNSAIGYENGARYYFDGVLDDVRVYDRALSGGEVEQLYREGLGGRDFNPEPYDGATAVDPNVILSWSPGQYAVTHDVYLGSDYTDVDTATTVSAEYMGNFDTNRWDPCGLEFSTTYYWRVDAVNGPNIWNGNVWSFETWSEFGPNLVGWWEFDEGTGTTTYDSAGGNDGSVYGANWTSGQIGGALEFDGVDDYVDLRNDSSLKPPLPVTIAAWVRLSGSGKTQRIVSIDEQSPTYYGIWLAVDAADTVAVSFGDGAGGASQAFRRSKTGTTTLGTGSWYHLAAVVKGATDIDIFVNGVDDNGSYSGSGGSLAYSSGNCAIGYENAAQYYFDGVMDDVRVYRRALTGGEVWQLYQSGL